MSKTSKVSRLALNVSSTIFFFSMVKTGSLFHPELVGHFLLLKRRANYPYMSSIAAVM